MKLNHELYWMHRVTNKRKIENLHMYLCKYMLVKTVLVTPSYATVNLSFILQNNNDHSARLRGKKPYSRLFEKFIFFSF